MAQAETPEERQQKIQEMSAQKGCSYYKLRLLSLLLQGYLLRSCAFCCVSTHKIEWEICHVDLSIANLSRQRSGTALKLLWQLLANGGRMDIGNR